MTSIIYYTPSNSEKNHWFYYEYLTTPRTIYMIVRVNWKTFVEFAGASFSKITYPCIHQGILQAFHIDTGQDSYEIHPQKLCISLRHITKCFCSKDDTIPWRYICMFHGLAVMFISHFIQHAGRGDRKVEEYSSRQYSTSYHRSISTIEELQYPICFDVLQQAMGYFIFII